MFILEDPLKISGKNCNKVNRSQRRDGAFERHYKLCLHLGKYFNDDSIIPYSLNRSGYSNV